MVYASVPNSNMSELLICTHLHTLTHIHTRAYYRPIAYCGIFVVGGLCLHRALHRCVLKETAPRRGFGFSALPVLQCEILLFFLGLGFPLLPIHSSSDLGSYSHSLYL